MSERSSYAAGTPSWVDIGSTDLDKTHAFYTGLFGWGRQEAGPPEETGGYGFYTLRDKLVAGYGPAQDPNGGVWWTTYVDVDDADKIAEAVTAHGGSVLAPPMDVMTAGRMAVFSDPFGAAFAVWQPGEHHGAQIVNEAGALSWNELLTRDLPGARSFYQAVFGWGEKNGPDSPYSEFTVADAVVAGGMAITSDMPAQMPGSLERLLRRRRSRGLRRPGDRARRSDPPAALRHPRRRPGGHHRRSPLRGLQPLPTRPRALGRQLPRHPRPARGGRRGHFLLRAAGPGGHLRPEGPPPAAPAPGRPPRVTLPAPGPFRPRADPWGRNLWRAAGLLVGGPRRGRCGPTRFEHLVR